MITQILLLINLILLLPLSLYNDNFGIKVDMKPKKPNKTISKNCDSTMVNYQRLLCKSF